MLKGDRPWSNSEQTTIFQAAVGNRSTSPIVHYADRKRRGARWRPFFCLIWLVAPQIDLRIDSPPTRARLQDAGNAPDHYRIGGYVKPSSNSALPMPMTRARTAGADSCSRVYALVMRYGRLAHLPAL